MSRAVYIAEGFEVESQHWREVVAWAVVRANAVEFNVLFEGAETEQAIRCLGTPEARLPPSERQFLQRRRLRFQLTPELSDLLRTVPFNGWVNEPLEDPSLWIDGDPLVETITHEGYVFAMLSDREREMFRQKGIDFEWPLS